MHIRIQFQDFLNADSDPTGTLTLKVAKMLNFFLQNIKNPYINLEAKINQPSCISVYDFRVNNSDPNG